jgi:hypothetical protein
VPRSVPPKYLRGEVGASRRAREREIARRSVEPANDPAAYRPFVTDEGRTTSPSRHTVAFHRQYGLASSVADAAKRTGIPLSILQKVYDRGLAAWRTGHRPGATQHQWAMARVYSFATGGPTWQTADADLAKRARAAGFRPGRSRTPNAGRASDRCPAALDLLFDRYREYGWDIDGMRLARHSVLGCGAFLRDSTRYVRVSCTLDRTGLLVMWGDRHDPEYIGFAKIYPVAVLFRGSFKAALDAVFLMVQHFLAEAPPESEGVTSLATFTTRPPATPARSDVENAVRRYQQWVTAATERWFEPRLIGTGMWGVNQIEVEETPDRLPVVVMILESPEAMDTVFVRVAPVFGENMAIGARIVGTSSCEDIPHSFREVWMNTTTSSDLHEIIREVMFDMTWDPE